MVYICTALYEEAEPFIEKLKLKKNLNITKFQVFESDEYRLMICGVGKIKASIAVTYMLSIFKPSHRDVFINVGICGTSNMNFQIGEIFIINKILDKDTYRSYFPDIIFKHEFKESQLVSASAVEKNIMEKDKFDLVDMEASSVYEAAVTFMQTNQVIFIKIISDYLEVNNLDKSFICSLMSGASEKICSWLQSIKSWNQYIPSFTEEEKNIIEKVTLNLRLSETMKNEFIQYTKYYRLNHGEILNVLETYRSMECKSRNEGKRYLAEIKQKLIS
ncbi:hypothetical protein IAI10_08930 [Clostridium sp. 19966]|uniref:5'-methylthioadenosine/S-adenosylhomocysteine nucleosidase family protein n=1 Tax=Clostridium sp. 19966 TaxID=2768166 RepID=UPI0028DD7642|nr:hypothetical protein [Clostridium sp. 19966]MDT8716781.1 hypothetical protein [Clostridium sp. 19966]